MGDVFDPVKRAAVMRAVKGRDTGPEMRVRRAAHAMGLRYRLHRRDLPGSPDLVFVSRRVALFVHGCFWHGHGCARGDRVPATNAEYWRAKIARNAAHDLATGARLAQAGWLCVIIWECEIRSEADLRALIAERLAMAEP
jgi:DNA mismatch endonuclease (patch repair protein)